MFSVQKDGANTASFNKLALPHTSVFGSRARVGTLVDNILIACPAFRYHNSIHHAS